MSKDTTTIIVTDILERVEAGEITKYIFGWKKPDGGSVIITSNDLSGFKTQIRNAITEARN